MANVRRTPRTLVELLATAISYGYYTNYTSKAKDWFRAKAQNLKTTGDTFLREANKETTDLKSKFTTNMTVGKMYFYNYDPKLKKILPYYDVFPLIFCIEKYKDGFLGINMNYLPPVLRAKLMDALYETITDQRYNDSTRLRVNYKLLKNVAKYKYYKPCVKRYLYKHVKSRVLNITPKEWEQSLFIPTAKFKKQSQETVWRDSRRIINRGR